MAIQARLVDGNGDYHSVSQNGIVGGIEISLHLCRDIVTAERVQTSYQWGMNAFPDFMKSPTNKIAASEQATPGVEGYVFDGADGTQMAFWTCHETAESSAHVHDFDEYMIVVQGCYTLVIDGTRIPVYAGEEYFVPRGVAHSGEVSAETRTIHAFGGHRADRIENSYRREVS